MAQVKVTVAFSFTVEDGNTASLIKDLLMKKKDTTSLSDSISIYDYSPDEEIVAVDID